jgi:hypothetical protein
VVRNGDHARRRVPGKLPGGDVAPAVAAPVPARKNAKSAMG